MARLDPTGVSRILTYIKTWITGLLSNKSDSSHTHSDYVPRSGGGVLNGTSFSRTVSNTELRFDGGAGWDNGASLSLSGKDRPDLGLAGAVLLRASDGSQSKSVTLYPDGDFVWNDSSTAKRIAFQEDTIPRSGGAVISGYAINRIDNAAYVELNGGTAWANGAGISLRGKDCSAYGDAGCFHILASDGTYTKSLSGRPDGTLTWDNHNIALAKDVVPRSGAPAGLSGNYFSRAVDDSSLIIGGGTSAANGATIEIFGAGYPNFGLGGALRIATQSYVHNMYMYANGTWTWDGTACQLTSDQRLKQQISNIDDKLLDAWEDVLPCQFKYNEAVEQKGDTARLHTGYVVQQIDEACKSHNLDISAYGLYCHEEYSERTEEVKVKQDDGSVIKETKVIEPAKEQYSLRYTEALIVECAYLRREVKRLSERLEKLEK